MRARVLLVASLVLVASPAQAQWYGGAFLGGNTTRPADVSVEVPASGLSVTFRNVKFSAEPLKSPQYYGLRVGRMVGAHRRFGVEFEMIHLKVISQTGAAYDTTGTLGPVASVPGLQMRAIVERYSMTHGLNFALVNLVSRNSIGTGQTALVMRAGGGPTVPHTETTVLGHATDRYEYGGPGLHASAGLEFRAGGKAFVTAEYKFTYARPEITVAGGMGHTTSASHHVAIGLSFGRR